MEKKNQTIRYDDKYYDEILNKNRVIFLYDLTDDGSAEKINKKLISMMLRNKKRPISIEINSPGGSCAGGLSIVDTIYRLIEKGTPVYTIISGRASSMGSVISIVAAKRFITKNAYYMMHPMTLGGGIDYLSFKQDRLKYAKELDNRLINLYRKHTKVPEKLIKKSIHGEVWLNAEECLKYGVVDKIL